MKKASQRESDGITKRAEGAFRVCRGAESITGKDGSVGLT